MPFFGFAAFSISINTNALHYHKEDEIASVLFEKSNISHAFSSSMICRYFVCQAEFTYPFRIYPWKHAPWRRADLL